MGTKLSMPLALGYLAAAVVLAGFVIEAAPRIAEAQQTPGANQETALKGFLQNYLSSQNSGQAKETYYQSAFVDLKDNGTLDAVVYLTGNGWCGSGGCTTLILSPKNSSYDVVARITVTRLPIRVLSTKSNAWHDIAVRVQGGGVIRAYDAELRFNGQTYPNNPTVPPAVRLRKEPEGKVVVPFGAAGSPLYN
jgi:hypothetical protein